jgi:curved DNA-binding protein
MEYKDYYKILGVKKDAPQDEIKRAYRKLSRKYHPDVSKEKDAEKHFKEVGEAYEVLKDPEKRAAYDQFGSGWRPGQDFRPPPDWQQGFSFGGGGFSEGGVGGFSDFFETLFGGRHGSARSSGQGRPGFQRRGEDVHACINIDLEDSFLGATRTLTLSVPVVAADGRGRARARERTLQVKIPKGITEGQQIRLQGQGGPPLGDGKPGDLYLDIAFRPHPHYRVDGKDLYLNLPIAPWEAALGAKIKVPTPAGVVDLQIPAGSNSGKTLRLKGRGLPGGQNGDFYVLLQIVLPPAEGKKVQEIYRKMERELSFNPRPALGV